MSKKRFYNKKRPVFQVLILSKKEIEKKYECFFCAVKANEMICHGSIQPTSESRKYKIRIKYNGKRAPVVHILNPNIEYDTKIHMYEDKSLCLFYPKEQPWSIENSSVAKLTIPWISEWLVYYELYQYFGKWYGPEAHHSKREAKSK